MFEGKKILITGGTGSLGSALTKRLLETNLETLRLFSRDEWKQQQMKSNFDDKRLRFLIGDVRDKERLHRALEGIDIVIHAAALKQVDACEYNPFEAVKTNVHGTQNLIDACLANNVKTTLAVGTDKAVSPFNTYGATKLLMERLFISANYYKGPRNSNFLSVRYGNVLGSRGSIVPTFIDQITTGKKITVTAPEMTRFTITMDQAVDLVMRSLTNGVGGEIFVPKLKAYKVKTMTDAIMELFDAKNEVEIISARSGEKYHESLISKDEIRNTFENDVDFVLLDKLTQSTNPASASTLTPVNYKDEYSSEHATLLSKQEIKDILIQEQLISQN